MNDLHDSTPPNRTVPVNISSGQLPRPGPLVSTRLHSLAVTTVEQIRPDGGARSAQLLHRCGN